MDLNKEFDDLVADATISEEMAAKVLKEFCGSYSSALIDILLYIHGMDDVSDLEEDEAEEVLASLRRSIDTVLNKEVERELLGAIPKD